MLDGLATDPDGGYTLYIPERLSRPGQKFQWLPAPQGPFVPVERLYWPKPEALDGQGPGGVRPRY